MIWTAGTDTYPGEAEARSTLPDDMIWNYLGVWMVAPGSHNPYGVPREAHVFAVPDYDRTRMANWRLVTAPGEDHPEPAAPDAAGQHRTGPDVAAAMNRIAVSLVGLTTALGELSAVIGEDPRVIPGWPAPGNGGRSKMWGYTQGQDDPPTAEQIRLARGHLTGEIGVWAYTPHPAEAERLAREILGRAGDQP